VHEIPSTREGFFSAGSFSWIDHFVPFHFSSTPNETLPPFV
jgi:hypothetical protein